MGGKQQKGVTGGDKIARRRAARDGKTEGGRESVNERTQKEELKMIAVGCKRVWGDT